MGKQEHSKKKYCKGKLPKPRHPDSTQYKILQKRVTDLERMIHHKEKEGLEIDGKKFQELKNLREEIRSHQRRNERKIRKDFFNEKKYKQIMDIEKRKVARRLKNLKQMEMTDDTKKQLFQWEKKLRYIKYYPKNLKYVSLFPSSKPLQEGAVDFQRKVMNEIEEKYNQRTQKIISSSPSNRDNEKGQKKQQILKEEQ